MCRHPLRPGRLTADVEGSGKSTLSHAIVAEYPSFVRLSIDGIVHEMHGVYGVDYPESMCDEYQDEAADIFEQRFRDRLDSGGDVVLDRSFHSKEDRDYFRKLIERRGGRVVLLYMKPPDKEKLWARVQERKGQKHALHGERLGDAAVETSRETFDVYWDGFEVPDGEGAIVMSNSINGEEHRVWGRSTVP
jgi:predicted kinase